MMTIEHRNFKAASAAVIKDTRARDLGVFELLAFVQAFWDQSETMDPVVFLNQYNPDDDTMAAFLQIVNVCHEYEKPC
jgi:hypothetical protein